MKIVDTAALAFIVTGLLLSGIYVEEKKVIRPEPRTVAPQRTDMNVPLPRDKEITITLGDTVISVKRPARHDGETIIELDEEAPQAKWVCSAWMESQVGGAYRKCGLQ